MSIENCNSLGLHKCESDCFVTGTVKVRGQPMEACISVFGNVHLSRKKKAFNPLSTETPLPAGSHRGQLVPLSTNHLIFSSCCSELKNHATIKLKIMNDAALTCMI